MSNKIQLTPAHRQKLASMGVLVTSDTNEYDLSQRDHPAFDNCGMRTELLNSGAKWTYFIFSVTPNGDIAITDEELESCADDCDKAELSPATGLSEYAIIPATQPTQPTQPTLRERWEKVIAHDGWDGLNDVDFLMKEYDITEAEMEMDEYDPQP